MMIMMDAPQHTRLRKLVSRAFTPRRIADLEAKIAKLCNDLLDTVDGQDEFDYIDTFAGLAPAHGHPRPRRDIPRATRPSSAPRPTRACTSTTADVTQATAARWSRRAARSTTRPSPSSRS